MSCHKVLLVLILLSGVSISGTDENANSGHLYLLLKDTNSYPMSTSPVFLTDTLGTTWNLIEGPRGEYSLTVPEGYYFLTARCITYETFRTDWMYITSSDTVSIEHKFRWYDFGDNTWQEFRPDTLQPLWIYLKADATIYLDGLTVFSVNEYFREERISDDCYLVHVDNTCFDLRWNLPSLGDHQSISIPFGLILRGEDPVVTIEVEDSPWIIELFLEQTYQNPVFLADITDNEWVLADYELRRILINPADWGHEELYKYGYVDGRAFFDQSDDDETWRIVLAFHRKVIVLVEDAEPVIHDLDSSMSRALFSPLGKYLFFFDATDGMSCREEGIMLNTWTGEERRFIPDPYAEPYEWNPSFSSMISTEPHWTYHPADDGTIIALFRDSIRLYDEQLEVTRTSYLEGMCLGEGHYLGIRQRSPDGDRIVAIDYNDEDCTLVLFNRDGSVESCTPVHNGNFRADRALTVLTSTFYNTGISAWDISDGSLLWHQDVTFSGGNIISPEGNLIGWSPEWAKCEVRSTQTGQLQDCFPTGEPMDAVSIGYLGDDGTSVILLNGHHTYRFALRSSSGELVWLSASRSRFPRTDSSYSSFSSIWDILTLSTDGETLVYNDGSLIHVLNFTRISD